MKQDIHCQMEAGQAVPLNYPEMALLSWPETQFTAPVSPPAVLQDSDEAFTFCNLKMPARSTLPGQSQPLSAAEACEVPEADFRFSAATFHGTYPSMSRTSSQRMRSSILFSVQFQEIELSSTVVVQKDDYVLLLCMRFYFVLARGRNPQ
ncbi:uncharacterized protein LOC116998837 isoform X3 [Catharus ustulatus]|uniref:uncharacterized protein LOC116998837 isoform X3 n=1 Tax=Catharus ustulatus TaxID=91951 RepID=UPI00140E1BDC|nr:uncharacterized protein LOC116998837 isoform X3 [Catharus ustulatus]